MSEFNFNTHTKKILADTITPVSVYLKIRDVFPNSLLLESSDYHANDNSFSYICCNPVASISVKNKQLHRQYPDGSSDVISLDSTTNLPTLIDAFARRFSAQKNGYKFITHGLFGYISYDAVQYFEQVDITEKSGKIDIPDLYYAVYQNVIAINHFKNEAYIFCHALGDENNIAQIEQLLQSKNIPSYHFAKQSEAVSNLTDAEFKENVALAKKHCHRGDVFQLVLSRRFQQAFKGDEFNVYRALRSINPSPYLFFFDYGDFKIFGSSPEAQLVVQDRKAEIHPIAGTFKRTGDDEQDAALAKQLSVDQKENSEHVMLVDLARNDLSRNGHDVTVEKYREVQYFSHVIHLVSKVTGQLHPDSITMQVVADTFPAGTLSGAPKHMAMQLIDKYEKTNRGFYGGALGFMDFEGNFNHAIMIRTLLSSRGRNCS
jgi:anthranilate synthase component 1